MIDVFNENAENSAVINYSFSILKKRKLSTEAIRVFGKYFLHLMLIYPYLYSLLGDFLNMQNSEMADEQKVFIFKKNV